MNLTLISVVVALAGVSHARVPGIPELGPKLTVSETVDSHYRY